MNYLIVAFRNLVRNRKRTLITVLTITLGFTALGTIGGILANIFSRLKEQAVVSERLGHFTIVKKGFMTDGKLNPEKYLWNNTDLTEILRIIRSHPKVEIATARINLNGMVSNGKASTIFITEGIEPAWDEKLFQTNVDGRENHPSIGTLPLHSEGIVSVSEELAENLKIKVGDILTLLCSTKDGITNAVDVEVGKIYNTGNPSTNDKFILSNLALIQKLYDTDGAQKVVVTIKDLSKTEETKNQLLEALKSKGYDVDLQTWNKLSVSYEKVKGMFGVIFRVLTVIISLIVLLTVLNTMQMNVNERTREIGALKAIGMSKRNIIKMFCAEGLIMGVIGCMVGVAMLFMVKTVLGVLHISFMPPVASINVPVYIVVTASQITITWLIFVTVGMLSSFLASRKIANQKVIDSLQYNN